MKAVGNSSFLEDIFGRILSPFERFLKQTTAGGIILMIAALASLALANSGAGPHVLGVLEQTIAVGIADWRLEMTLHEWINDGWMTLFFLLVGLELKRELMVGELSSFREASLPIAAALGGMIVPALIYWAINPAGPSARGWGIPMATDIAFAVGILVLLGSRIPSSLTVFLTALAIADDLGAVAVIAFFYTGDISFTALAAGAVLLALLLILNRGGVRHPLPYAGLGLLLWISLLKSGVHPTITGILLACFVPARSNFTPPEFAMRVEQLREDLLQESADPYACEHAISCPGMAEVAEDLEKTARAVQSPQQRLEHALTPWVTFIVLPTFAFSNLGIDLSKVNWDAAVNSITLGVVLGLVAGKLIGITVFSLIAVRLKVGELPRNVGWRQIIGIGWLGGIGFTMSLFIGNLAFPDPAGLERAKIGILAASMISACVGVAWLYFARGTDHE